MKKALFIDRDGTLVIEPPVDYQLDSFHKLEFYPKVFRNLGFIHSKLDFEFVMVTNQDGLGTSSFPEDAFWPVHNLVLKTLEGEGITFDDILIDRSFPEDHVPTRKPGTGMMGKYLTGDYDLANSFVIGDRVTDVELAKNMGCKAILLQDNMDILKEKELESYCVLVTTDWDKVAEFLFAGERIAEASSLTEPLYTGRYPKIACITSLRPAPTNPENPRISPFFSLKLTLVNLSPVRLFTSSNTSSDTFVE